MKEELQKIDFFDSTIEEMNINYSKDTLAIIFELNEENNYKTIKLNFTDFSDFKMEPLQTWDLIELNKIDFKKEEGQYSCEILALLGHSKPSMDIFFKFKTYSIEEL